MVSICNILNFWFGGGNGNSNSNAQKYQKYWFDGSMDSFITEKYTDLLTELSKQEDLYNEWIKTYMPLR